MSLTFRKKFYFKGKSKTKHPAYKFRRKKILYIASTAP